MAASPSPIHRRHCSPAIPRFTYKVSLASIICLCLSRKWRGHQQPRPTGCPSHHRTADRIPARSPPMLRIPSTRRTSSPPHTIFRAFTALVTRARGSPSPCTSSSRTCRVTSPPTSPVTAPAPPSTTPRSTGGPAPDTVRARLRWTSRTSSASRRRRRLTSIRRPRAELSTNGRPSSMTTLPRSSRPRGVPARRSMTARVSPMRGLSSNRLPPRASRSSQRPATPVRLHVINPVAAIS